MTTASIVSHEFYLHLERVVLFHCPLLFDQILMPIMLVKDEIYCHNFDPSLSLLCAHMTINERMGTRDLEDSLMCHHVCRCRVVCLLTVECVVLIVTDHLLHFPM